MEKILKDSLLQIFENSHTGVAIVEENGLIKIANEKFCSIVDRKKSDISGLHFKDITHPDDLNIDMLSFEKIKAGEVKSYEIQKRYIKPDGSISNVLLHVAKVKNGPYYVATVSCLDKVIDNQLLLKEKQSILELAVQSASHDFRGPILNIDYALEKCGDELSDQNRTLIKNSLERIKTSMQQFVEFANFGSTKNNKKVEDYKVLIKSAAKVNKLEIKKINRSEITYFPTVNVSWLESCLFNIFNNINDHCGVKNPEIHVDIEQRHEKVVISIENSGKEAEELHREKMFNLFFSSKKNKDQSGIGLAIVKKFCTHHRGKATVGKAQYVKQGFRIQIEFSDCLF